MSWRYGAKRDIDAWGDTTYYLVEVYDLNDEGDLGWTDEPVHVTSETKEGLVKWLRQAADDIEKHDAVEDTVRRKT